MAVAERRARSDPTSCWWCRPGRRPAAAVEGAACPWWPRGSATAPTCADGSLAPRSQPGSVLVEPAGRPWAVAMALGREVKTIDGSAVVVDCDTLCVHGDTPGRGSRGAAVRPGAAGGRGVRRPLRRRWPVGPPSPRGRGGRATPACWWPVSGPAEARALAGAVAAPGGRGSSTRSAGCARCSSCRARPSRPRELVERVARLGRRRSRGPAAHPPPARGARRPRPRGGVPAGRDRRLTEVAALGDDDPGGGHARLLAGVRLPHGPTQGAGSGPPPATEPRRIGARRVVGPGRWVRRRLPPVDPGRVAAGRRTPVRLFDPVTPPFALLRPGDTVRLDPVRTGGPGPAPVPAGPDRVPRRRSAPAGPRRRAAWSRRPGLLTTVQDGGRSGLAHLGVPGAGPADPLAHALANRLVGTPGRPPRSR